MASLNKATANSCDTLFKLIYLAFYFDPVRMGLSIDITLSKFIKYSDTISIVFYVGSYWSINPSNSSHK